MNTRKALFLAAILGAVAILISVVLLQLGRSSNEAEVSEASYEAQYVDAAAMVRFVETLASDALEGRATGTTGNEAARGFILKRYETIGLSPMDGRFEQRFEILPMGDGSAVSHGVNVVGWLPGETPGEGPLMVVTAHYDHLGIKNGEIYNGADDNASGVSAMIAIAHYLKTAPRKHDIVFAALDGEEIGFVGSVDLMRRLLDDERIGAGRIALNINLDMVSRSDVGELYVAGTHHSPDLSELIIDGVIADAPATLIKGHDTPDLGSEDWSMQSDHAVFLAAGIPFLYFGVEDHAGYHTPQDDADQMTLDFYARSADTIAMALMASDAKLNEISKIRN